MNRGLRTEDGKTLDPRTASNAGDREGLVEGSIADRFEGVEDHHMEGTGTTIGFWIRTYFTYELKNDLLPASALSGTGTFRRIPTFEPFG